MSDYISRQAVIETARCGYHNDFGRSMADLTSLKEVLEDTPTADVVEVVRCKDCRNYYEYDDFDRYIGQFYKAKECDRLQCDLGECGFCSYGERKE